MGETTVRGREYPWGVVEIENEQHCDFVKLREMLIRTNMEDLREVSLSNTRICFLPCDYTLQCNARIRSWTKNLLPVLLDLFSASFTGRIFWSY